MRRYLSAKDHPLGTVVEGKIRQMGNDAYNGKSTTYMVIGDVTIDGHPVDGELTYTIGWTAGDWLSHHTPAGGFYGKWIVLEKKKYITQGYHGEEFLHEGFLPVYWKANPADYFSGLHRR
jgi:hypothetical protein